MACCITVNGSNFDVDGFLSQTKLDGIHIRRKGDLLPKGRVLKQSEISMDLCEADVDVGLTEQIQKTIAFLKKNKKELKRLSKYSGVDEVYISFGIPLRDEVAIFDFFPAELLSLAGSIGLGIHLCQFRCRDEPVAKRPGKKSERVRLNP